MLKHSLFPPRSLSLAPVALVSALSCSGALAQEAAAARLDCAIGPVHKTFGAAPWLVFACSDAKSLVIVSAPGNAGNPFFFKIYVKDGRRHVVAEGAGSKKVTAAAYNELAKLAEADVAALISAANAIPKAAAK